MSKKIKLTKKEEYKIMMLDCEANGLYDDTIAATAIVVEIENGEIIEIDMISLVSDETNPNNWVKENVIPKIQNATHVKTKRELRDKFYEFYLKHKENCYIFSDVNFPVETNFLAQIAKDDLINREFNMPYPLYDLSMYLDVNIDRFTFAFPKTKKYKVKVCNARYQSLGYLNGYPHVVKIEDDKHNPLCDALCSLVCLLKLMNIKIDGSFLNHLSFIDRFNNFLTFIKFEEK